MKRILIIEDDFMLNTGLCYNLELDVLVFLTLQYLSWVCWKILQNGTIIV